MNQSELKEAIRQIKICNVDKDFVGVQTLLDLATQYLDIKGFPEEAEGTDEGDSDDRHPTVFNRALHLCKLAQMKKLEGIEDVLNKTWDGWYGEGKMPYADEIAQAIRQHMGGK
jgi:hypothetical protein